MDIGNLDLSEAAWLCLGKLAMAVELKCGKRFAFRKAVADMVGLLEVAEASADAQIRRRRDEFLRAIPPGVQRMLAGGGVGAGEVASGAEGPAERYYRGARMGDGSAAVAPPKRMQEPSAETGPAAPADAALDSQGRKRIVYRGKVIYV